MKEKENRHAVEGPAFSGCINQKMKLEIRKFSKTEGAQYVKWKKEGKSKEHCTGQTKLSRGDIVFNDSEAESTDAEQSGEKTM